MAFGLLVNKWRIFKRPLQQGLESNITVIVKILMPLHNYIINQQLAENEEYFVREEIESEFNQYAAECQGNDENPYDSVQLPST